MNPCWSSDPWASRYPPAMPLAERPPPSLRWTRSRILSSMKLFTWWGNKRPRSFFCNVSSRISHLMFLVLQQQIIYYLCVLLKDPSNPDAASSIVPLFQVRLTHLQSAVLRILHFSRLQRTVFSFTTFPCLSEFQAKAGLFGEGLQKLPGDSFKVLITTEWCINAVTLSKIYAVIGI